MDENDPTMFIRKYIDDVRKTISEIESAYRAGSANRNKIVKDCLLRVQRIEQSSLDTEQLLTDHLQGLAPPEDSNSTIESKVEETIGFVRDMLLWGPKGYAYLSGDLDRQSGKVTLPRGYQTFAPVIRKVRGGNAEAPVLIQIGEKIHPVEKIVSPDQQDIAVHFNPSEVQSFKQLDKKIFPRVNIK